MQVFYQICDLQIFSSIQRSAFPLLMVTCAVLFKFDAGGHASKAHLLLVPLPHSGTAPPGRLPPQSWLSSLTCPPLDPSSATASATLHTEGCRERWIWARGHRAFPFLS